MGAELILPRSMTTGRIDALSRRSEYRRPFRHMALLRHERLTRRGRAGPRCGL